MKKNKYVWKMGDVRKATGFSEEQVRGLLERDKQMSILGKRDLGGVERLFDKARVMKAVKQILLQKKKEATKIAKGGYTLDVGAAIELTTLSRSQLHRLAEKHNGLSILTARPAGGSQRLYQQARLLEIVKARAGGAGEHDRVSSRR